MKTEAVCDIMKIEQKLQQRVALAAEMTSRIENKHDFLNHIIFSEEATFHMGNEVNISTTAEFGAQKIPCSTESRKNTPKINVWCALLHDTVIGLLC
ncbi:hypothetical protein AVEN_250687-1 [Araneus ventricosus]|uniref:Uncharacterized protein n=1 Tax=Araneus ventricosus TaxID=182803 RepID=A0A4Y2N2L9_ARAVE|nr:hypothetical protein AVEN_250687-1 [Araneus ventricosus]